jgi:hypothetical protein
MNLQTFALCFVGMTEPVPDLAYYYPARYWGIAEADRLKSLLLFFDGIVILLPSYMHGRESAADPVLAGPLREMGLLKLLEPETFVDQTVTEALITAVADLITSGAFDNLDRPTHAYQGLSRSRMGWGADVELSDMITEELVARGLARPSEDGVSVPLHPVIRATFLVLLSQLARGAGRRAGIELHPATTSYRAVQDYFVSCRFLARRPQEIWSPLTGRLLGSICNQYHSTTFWTFVSTTGRLIGPTPATSGDRSANSA